MKVMTSKPSKQRKMIFQAPNHLRQKLFAAPLSPELRATHRVKSLSVRSGDTVRIIRGDHKGFEGKVTRVDRNKYRIYVEGLTREKVDGTTIFVPIHPSKVMITKLNLDDKWRKKILERKKGALRKAEKVEEAAEKPPEKIEEEIAEKPPAKPKRTRRAPRKTTAKKTEKTAEKEEEKEKKSRKTRTKRESKKKTEGET
ncbi:50S ribosomal protein L24 [Candidatus Bathyarchaeota archaeon]|nr:MAG: 50S ribosomal protein L24 [Candidatus Bathyarchaeota archaeon]